MKAGTRCRVIEDNSYFFEPGEIVVTLEDSDVPYCVRESAYSPEKSIGDYNSADYNAMAAHELEVIGD